MRVLVVSHASVVEINQEPFRALSDAGADVLVVAPRALRTDVRGKISFKPLPGFESHVVAVPVAIGGYSKLAGGQRGIHLIVYRGLRAIASSFAPDVVFAEEEPFSLAALQAARMANASRAPFVFHANQNVTKSLPAPFPGIRKAVFRHAAGATVRNAAAGTVLASQGFDGDIEEFPHAVDVARFSGDGRRSGGAPVVGFVGRLVPEKGLEILIDAIAAVRGLGSNAELLVVGDGPERAHLVAHAHARGVPATFTGAVEHERVPSFYPEMDLVAIPSLTTPGWKEQFGRIVIEANAAGVPVVVSSSGELPATVAATGGGVVVPESDPAALRDALAELLGDSSRRTSLGAAGRAGVQARFTPDAVGRRLLAFLQRIVEKRGAS